MHITVLMFAVHTWGYAFFNFGVYPDWAPTKDELKASTNATGNFTVLPTICTVVNASAY